MSSDYEVDGDLGLSAVIRVSSSSWQDVSFYWLTVHQERLWTLERNSPMKAKVSSIFSTSLLGDV